MLHSLFQNLGLSLLHSYTLSSDTVQATLFLPWGWIRDIILLLRSLKPRITAHFSLVCL